SFFLRNKGSFSEDVLKNVDRASKAYRKSECIRGARINFNSFLIGAAHQLRIKNSFLQVADHNFMQVDFESHHKILEQVVDEGTCRLQSFKGHSISLGFKPADNNRQTPQAIDLS